MAIIFTRKIITYCLCACLLVHRCTHSRHNPVEMHSPLHRAWKEEMLYKFVFCLTKSNTIKKGQFPSQLIDMRKQAIKKKKKRKQNCLFRSYQHKECFKIANFQNSVNKMGLWKCFSLVDCSKPREFKYRILSSVPVQKKMKSFNLLVFYFPVQKFYFYIYNSQTFFMAAFQTQCFSDLSIVPFIIQNPESVANNGGNPAEFKRRALFLSNKQNCP